MKIVQEDAFFNRLTLFLATCFRKVPEGTNLLLCQINFSTVKVLQLMRNANVVLNLKFMHICHFMCTFFEDFLFLMSENEIHLDKNVT